MFCYCAQSRRIARLLTVRYDAALAPAGITAAQFETLSLLRALGSIGGSELAAQMAVDKTTLSRNLQSLLTEKLITAKRDEEDARKIIYALAPAGEAKLKKAMPLWQKEHAQTQTLLGTHAAPTERTLQRMAHAL